MPTPIEPFDKKLDPKYQTMFETMRVAKVSNPEQPNQKNTDYSVNQPDSI